MGKVQNIHLCYRSNSKNTLYKLFCKISLCIMHNFVKYPHSVYINRAYISLSTCAFMGHKTHFYLREMTLLPIIKFSSTSILNGKLLFN